MLFLLFWLAISGLVVGGLGRLLVPGRDNLGIGATILIGLSSSFASGLLARLGFGWRLRYAAGFGFIIAVLIAAMFVFLLTRKRRSGSDKH